MSGRTQPTKGLLVFIFFQEKRVNEPSGLTNGTFVGIILIGEVDRGGVAAEGQQSKITWRRRHQMKLQQL